MSSEEREIEIESPGNSSVMFSGDIPSIVDQMTGHTVLDGVEFVCIPSDDDKPIRSCSLPLSVAAKSGDSLPDYVKPYFADKKTVDTALLKEQAKKQFAGGNLENLTETNISSAAMNAVAAQGSVETFTLVHPADTNQFSGVYIYLDELGLLKKLPTNSRATQLAVACGFHPPPKFCGDVFVGRVQSKPVLKNKDFVAGVDTDGGAEWIQRAVSENLAWHEELKRVTGGQPSHAGTEGTVVKEDDFHWTQDEDEVEITVPFDCAVDKKKVKVSFQTRSVTVKYNGSERLSTGLYGTIDCDGSTWTIDGKRLVLTCEKANGGELWPRLR